MAWKDIHDPGDPWAWRNKYTGEARTDYAELWIVIPLIVLLVLLALIAVIPIFIHAYCRSACPCPSFWSVFDNFLQVLHDYGRKNTTAGNNSFENPAFDPELGPKNETTNIKSGNRRPNQINDNPRLSHLRHSVREEKYKKNSNSASAISRSKSCPPTRPSNVPRIKI
uniref:Uncharacterized protein n=1 Tax=Panagrolaimus davidi TaxID=227884 RepID=A0A914PMM0_9BILA